MSNDEIVRPNGYYLVKECEDSSLEVVYIRQSKLEGYTCVEEGISFDACTYNELHWCGSEKTSEPDQCYWIADEPLDLECIKLLQMNGGLQNAVELVKKDAMV